MNTEARKRLDTILNEWVLDQENPKLSLQLAEVYRELNQPAAAFSHYMKVYEVVPVTDFELRYYCIMSMCEIYWNTGNRLKGVIHHARLAKAEQPDRPEAYFMLANCYREMCIRDNVQHHYEWIEVYENAKIGILLAESGHDRENSKFYIGVDYLRYLYILACIRCGKLIEAKEHIKDIEINNLESWAIPRVIDLYKELGLRVPMQSYDKKVDGEIDIDIERNYAPLMQDIFVLRTLDGNTEGEYLDLTNNGPVENNCTYLLSVLGWTGKSITTEAQNVNRYSEKRLNPIYYVDLGGYELCELIKDDVDYLNIDLGNVDANISALMKLPMDDFDAKIITIRDYEAFGNQAKALEIVKFLKNKGYYLVAHIASDGVNHTDAWYLNSKYFSREVIDDYMNRYSNCNLVKAILI